MGKQNNVFSLLHPRLKSILSYFELVNPTPIQEKAIPIILRGFNTIISSPTGTGKTEAAVLPIFSLMLNKLSSIDLPQLVYITPLRALNRDIYRRLIDLSERIGLKSMVRHGDSTRSERSLFLRSRFHWFITTPETFSIMLSHPMLRNRLSKVKWVVLDEVHELIDSERGSIINVVLLRLKRLSGSFQFIGLSATIPDEDVFKKFYPCGRKCFFIKDETPHGMNLAVVTDEKTVLSGEKRIDGLLMIIARWLDNSGSSIIFTNTRDTAEYLGFKLRENGLNRIGVHHGSLSFGLRKSVEEEFRKGSVKTVISTSSLELGIDIGNVDLVIQYGSPRQALRMTQRVGRSGHAINRVSRGVVVAEPVLDDVVESLVISRRTLEGLLEKPRVHLVPLDVLANQIIGMTLGGETRFPREIYDFIHGTFIFHNLGREVFEKTLGFLFETKLLGKRIDGSIYARRRAREYYYSTTMIPDTKRIPVYTVFGDRIGYLDEDFVVSRLEGNSRFLLAGREWVVVELTSSRVIVEEALEKTGLPPSWQGEIIPVEHEVAKEACNMITRVYKGEEYNALLKQYPMLTTDAYNAIKKIVKEAEKQGFLPPNPNYLLVEKGDEFIVLYTCLGSRGNNALSILITHILSKTTGRRYGFHSDPYRIFIEAVNDREVFDRIIVVLNDLSRLNYNFLTELLKEAIRRTGMFQHRLVTVAKKMGVLSPNASMDVVKRRIRFLRETIVGDEALREILTEKMDLFTVHKYLLGFSRGDYNVKHMNGLSPFTVFGPVSSRFHTIVSEGLPRDVVVKMLEKRIMEKRVLLLCLKCGWEREFRVSGLSDEIICPKCGSRALVPIHPGNTGLLNTVRKYVKHGKRGFEKEERDFLREAINRANLVLAYGKFAVYALIPYGVGSRGAKRALSRLKLGWKDFLWALYQEERNYFRTRRFWD